MLIFLPTVSGFYFSIKSGYDSYGEKQINIVLIDTYQSKYYEHDNKDYYPRKYEPEKTRETIYKFMDSLETYQASYIDEENLYANKIAKYDYKNSGYEKSRWRYKEPYKSEDYKKDSYQNKYYYSPHPNKEDGYYDWRW